MVEGERNGSMRLRFFQFGSLEAVEQNSVLGTQRRRRWVDVRYDGTSTVESSGKPGHSTIAPIHQITSDHIEPGGSGIDGIGEIARASHARESLRGKEVGHRRPD